MNAQQYRIGFTDYLVIPKSHDPVTLLLDVPASRRVSAACRVIIVLTTVNFDYEPFFRATEIHDEWAH